jgi:DeoR/GlpR family transcriptional regulator of sugar metabolism
LRSRVQAAIDLLQFQPNMNATILRRAVRKSAPSAAEPAAIAMEAAKLVAPGDCLILGAGVLTLALANELSAVPNLTVVTNSLRVCEGLVDAPGIELILVGGSLRRPSMALVGPTLDQTLCGLQASTAFLSAGGLTAWHGLSTSDLMLANADQALAAAGRRIVVLAEGSRVGRAQMWRIVPCECIDVLITSSGADRGELGRVKNAGVDVRLVDPLSVVS